MIGLLLYLLFVSCNPPAHHRLPADPRRCETQACIQDGF
jgi:hypothetical protein